MAGIEERAGLRGKRAIVIGGGFGQGEAVSLALAESGVDVAICDSDGEALPGTIKACEAAGVTAFGECFDALDNAALSAFYGRAGERFGHLDIVVNIVGGCYMQPFDETGPEDWARDIQRNFGYVIHSTKSALPLLRKSGRGGSIINFTTIEAQRGAATIAVYAGAKAATSNFSRALAVEFGREGIRINMIASDNTPTRNTRSAINKSQAGLRYSLPGHIFKKGTSITTPLGRAPTVEEIANGVLFLASDLSMAVTGTVLHTDGGTFAASGFNYWPHDDYFAPGPMGNTLRRMFHDELEDGK